MNAEIPASQLRAWGIRRVARTRRALYGVDELLRMSRHAGRAYVRPVTANRSLIVWRPTNRFLQPVIARCGRVRITNEYGYGPHMALPVAAGTIRVRSITGTPFMNATVVDGRECFEIVDAEIAYELTEWPTIETEI